MQLKPAIKKGLETFLGEVLKKNTKHNLTGAKTKKDFEFPDQKIIYAKPGQAIIFNGWIYHRGLGNKSKSNRRVCLICYQNSWMKSRETFDGLISSNVRENGTDLQKLLLGKIDKW